VTRRSRGYGDVTVTYIRRSEIPSRIYTVTPRSRRYRDDMAMYIRRAEIPSRTYTKPQYRKEI